MYREILENYAKENKWMKIQPPAQMQDIKKAEEYGIDKKDAEKEINRINLLYSVLKIKKEPPRSYERRGSQVMEGLICCG